MDDKDLGYIQKFIESGFKAMDERASKTENALKELTREFDRRGDVKQEVEKTTEKVELLDRRLSILEEKASNNLRFIWILVTAVTSLILTLFGAWIGGQVK